MCYPNLKIYMYVLQQTNLWCREPVLHHWPQKEGTTIQGNVARWLWLEFKQILHQDNSIAWIYNVHHKGACFRLSVAFEAPPSVPKLPSVDQLPNYGTTAFLKWLKPQNPRMGDNIFSALTKILQEPENIYALAHKFLRTVNNFPRRDLTFPRNPKYFCASPRISAQANKYLRTYLNVLGHK